MYKGKALLLVMDGLGDRPVDGLGNRTPLEAAATPVLDALATLGEVGLMHTCGRGVRPGSDVAHLAILGYPPADFYTGRGPIEAAGVGMELRPGDIAFRCNFATVDGCHLLDRRAGRIGNTAELVASVDGMVIEGVVCRVGQGSGHRAALVLQGEGLSGAVTDADPHGEGDIAHVVPKDASPEAAKTARVLNAFIHQAMATLDDHWVNIQRAKDGLLPANALVPRGGGAYPCLPAFDERYGLSAAVVAGGGLYRGIGSMMGMDVIDVPGATALPDSDLDAKVSAGLGALGGHDFVFMHFKAADSLGEDGNCEGKLTYIEKADRALRPLLEAVGEGLLVCVTADHSTPCSLSAHSADPVPLLFAGPGVRTDDAAAFGERVAAHGGLGHMVGTDVMPQVMNLLARTHLYGA